MIETVGRWVQIAAAALISGLCGMTACRSESPGDNTNGNINAIGDSGVDSDADIPPFENLTIVVEEYSPTLGQYIPTEDAAVAFDRPEGERQQKYTDATGRVTFTDLDWSAGQGALTVFRTGHVMVSYIHLDRPRLAQLTDDIQELWIGLEPLEQTFPERVEVSGTVTGAGPLDTSHSLHVGVYRQSGEHFAQGYFYEPQWSVSVPQGEEVSLLVREISDRTWTSDVGYSETFHAAARLDLGPLTQDATGFVVDLETPTQPVQTASVSVLMPPLSDSQVDYETGWRCVVGSTTLSSDHGWATSMTVADNNSRLDVDFIWVEPAAGVSLWWSCQSEWPYTQYPDYPGMTFFAAVSGAPQEGDEITMMEPPHWITPADPTVEHPRLDPMEIELFEAVTHNALVFLVEGRVKWFVYGRANATTFTAPDAPAGVAVYGILGIHPTVVAVAGTWDDTVGWTRFSRSTAARIAE